MRGTQTGSETGGETGSETGGQDRMVVGTLNLGSETGLQFKVPTTMRRHGVTGAQTGSEKGIETGGKTGQNTTKMLQCKVPTTIWGKGRHREQDKEQELCLAPVSLHVWASLTPCLLMVVGTLNCSPISLPRFRVPTTILSCPLSCPLSRSLSGSPSPHASSWWWGP